MIIIGFLIGVYIGYSIGIDDEDGDFIGACKNFAERMKNIIKKLFSQIIDKLKM